jgi:hypothetical protein
MSRVFWLGAPPRNRAGSELCIVQIQYKLNSGNRYIDTVWDYYYVIKCKYQHLGTACCILTYLCECTLSIMSEHEICPFGTHSPDEQGRMGRLDRTARPHFCLCSQKTQYWQLKLWNSRQSSANDACSVSGVCLATRTHGHCHRHATLNPSDN